jgi:hypothetical protein
MKVLKLVNLQLILILVVGVVIGYLISNSLKSEGFQDSTVNTTPTDLTCSNCGMAMPSCPPMPDMTKYVLKTSVPPCQTCPDMANYMLKTECPPATDLSQYVLKSSIPKPEPIIIDNSACRKNCGECPPCPRPRCPEVKCPPPVSCPACAPCPRQTCPEKVVKCKAEDADTSPVRPYLTPLSVTGFGAA